MNVYLRGNVSLNQAQSYQRVSHNYLPAGYRGRRTESQVQWKDTVRKYLLPCYTVAATPTSIWVAFANVSIISCLFHRIYVEHSPSPSRLCRAAMRKRLNLYNNY